MPIMHDGKDDMESAKILDGDGTAPKAVPEDTSAIGEDGVPLSPRDHSGVQFISPSRDSGNGDAKVELGGVGPAPQFVGLGKEELMRYANDPFWVRLRWFLFILFWLIWLGMLAAAIAIIIMAPKCTSTAKVAVHLANKGPFYQIGLNAVVEADKFAGLKGKVDYITDLGAQTVIISQFQKSTDLSKADETAFGSEAALDELIKAFSAKKIRVLLQLSPNQINKEYSWPENKGPRDYFVIKEAESTNKSTWESLYGGKAWSPFGNGSENYLHQFRESEPDLNYLNLDGEAVKLMNGVLQRWYNFSNDIHGFLLSDVSYLVEDLDHLDIQASTINQKGNKAVLEKILDSSSWDLGTRLPPFALLDVDKVGAKESLPLYAGNEMIPIVTDLATDLKPNFTAMDLQSHATSVKSNFVIRRLSGPRIQRVGSRYTEKRADILATVAFLLRGEIIIYYGDEVGTINANVPTPGTVDISLEPMEWNPDSTESKVLNFYKCLSKIHKSIDQADVQSDDGTIYHADDDVFTFKRGEKYVVVANLNEAKVELDLSDKLSVSNNGTLRCVTPNLGMATDIEIVGTKFEAEALSAYVLEFEPK